MAKRMTLDETWKNCLSMWRWIAKRVRYGCAKNVSSLKREWLKDHRIADGVLFEDCFFCHYHLSHKRRVRAIEGCEGCPAVFVDRGFVCTHDNYDYDTEPIAFYNKLVSLNRKRLKNKKG